MNQTLPLCLCSFARKLLFSFIVASLSLCSVYSQESSGAVVQLQSSLNFKGTEGLAFAPVTKLLAVTERNRTVRIVDVTSGDERALLSFKKQELLLRWTNDGQRLLIVGSKVVTIWDARLGKALAAPVGLQRKRDFLSAAQVEWNPAGTAILTFNTDSGFKASFREKYKATVQLWDVKSGELKFEVTVKGSYVQTQFSPDGKQLLTASGEEDARLWDIETGALIAVLKPPERSVTDGSFGTFSPDGELVAVKSYDSGIYIWDSATGTLKTTVALSKSGDGFELREFSPDGKLFALDRQQSKGRHMDNSIELRDGVTGKIRVTLTGKHMNGFESQRVWSPDSQTYITADSGKKYEAKIWDVKTGRLKGTFPMVLTYSWIPLVFGSIDRDNLLVHPTLPIVMAANEKFVRFWSTDTGELMQKIDDTGGPAQWSADGTLLLTFRKRLEVAHVWRVVLPQKGPSKN
ncbi:MAG TPA: hypothetical protein VJ875_02240 [Pyrinomonadaceae bacterium]|nr:hypothetical protein [Pyrinomonadaceae bacterium]